MLTVCPVQTNPPETTARRKPFDFVYWLGWAVALLSLWASGLADFLLQWLFW